MESKFLVQHTLDDTSNKNVKSQSFRVAKPDFLKSNTTEDFLKTARSKPKYSQLKFDGVGNLKAHSVLGNVEDFIDQAGEELNDETHSPKKAENNVENPRTSTSIGQNRVNFNFDQTTQNKPPKTAPVQGSGTSATFSQNNALENWQKRMAERKRIHGRISELVPRNPGSASLMNSADGQRKINETRMDIDKAIPAIDYGKGFRSGSEFWRLHENIGDDVTGLKMTLTKSERGLGDRHIERIGKPSDILDETAENTVLNKRFYENTYLKDRMKQLDSVIIRTRPVDSNLLIRGQSRPAQTAPEIISNNSRKLYMTSTPACENNALMMKDLRTSKINPDQLQKFAGPILKINNQTAKYSEHHNIEERILLQTNANGEITSSNLVLENYGSTRIKFYFRRLDNDGISMEPPRFFFNRLGGCVLPGETVHFPFHFKSRKPGIFTENWVLETEPSLLSGGTISLRLYAIAYDTDEMKEKRETVKRMLSGRESGSAAKAAFEDILVKAFDEVSKKACGMDLGFALHNVENRFKFSNSQWQGKVDFIYRQDEVGILEKIWRKYVKEEHWNYDISELKSRVTNVLTEVIGGEKSGEKKSSEKKSGENKLVESVENQEKPDNQEIEKEHRENSGVKCTEEEIETDLMLINQVVNNLRENRVLQTRRSNLLMVEKVQQRKSDATYYFNQMAYKLFDSGAGLKVSMKLDGVKGEKTSRGESATSQKSSRNSARKDAEINKKQLIENPIPENDVAEIEARACKKVAEQFTDRLHTIADSLFTNFIDNILDNFERK